MSKKTITDQFKRTQEDCFQPKTLEDIYWADPNSSRATIARSIYERRAGHLDVIEHQGIKS